MKESGGGFRVLSHLIMRCTLVDSDVVLQPPSENFFQQAYFSSPLMLWDLHSKYRYRCRASGLSPVRTGLWRMSQMSSLQNPRSSASKRCCFARLQAVVLTSHAPFDHGRICLPCLRPRDARMCLLWFGFARAPDASAHTRHPIPLAADPSRACGGTCAASLAGLSCRSVCGIDRSPWSRSSAPRCGHPTSSRKRSRAKRPCIRVRDSLRRAPSALSKREPYTETATWRAPRCCLSEARYRSPHRRIGCRRGVARVPDRCASRSRTADLQEGSRADAHTH